jgi:hypothetical protein
MLGQTFSPFPTSCLLFYQPHCHNHAPLLHLHLVTHYLDRLWSSTRLESLTLSLRSFKFCIFNPRLLQLGPVLQLSILGDIPVPRHSRCYEYCCMLGPRLYVRHPLHLSLRMAFTCIRAVHSLTRVCLLKLVISVLLKVLLEESS